MKFHNITISLTPLKNHIDYWYFWAHLVGQKVDDGNRNENECNGAKMKSRGKLGNDEKVKFVGSGKMRDWERKFVG